MNSVSEPRSQWGSSRPAVRWVGAIALLSGLAFVGVRLFLARSPEPEATAPLQVETVTLTAATDLTLSRSYTGEIAAGRTSELGFEQGGELVTVLVDRGDRVAAGQPLARLDTRRLQAQRSQLVSQRDRALAQLAELQNGPRQEDIAAAAATVQDLERQLDLARLQQERREFLYTTGAISREERDVVAFNADALEERLQAARSQLEELETGTRPEQIAAQQATVQQLAASIEDLDIAIEKGTLYAPYAGTIAARRLDEGAIVQPGQAVVRLVESAQTEVEVGLPVAVVTDLAVGQPQSITVNDVEYDATIAAILPEIDPTTRTQTVVLALTALENATLPPEQLVELDIAQASSLDGFWLPMTALVQGDRGLWAVYALRSADAGEVDTFQIERRQVELLHAEAERAFVRGVINAGDRIVADGTQRLVPGQTVQGDP